MMVAAYLLSPLYCRSGSVRALKKKKRLPITSKHRGNTDDNNHSVIQELFRKIKIYCLNTIGRIRS